MTTALAAIGTATWWTFLTLGLWPSFTWSLFRKLGDDIHTIRCAHCARTRETTP